MIKTIFNKISRILSSTKTTIILLSSFVVVFLLGQWIPQKKILGELYFQWREESPELVALLDYIGFTDIYTSPIVIFLFAIFFLNLLFVMSQRIKVIKWRISVPSLNEQDLASYPLKAEINVTHVPAFPTLKKVLRGYSFYGNERNFVAVKNRYSPLATLLFHLSFILLLIGGILTTYTRFSANLDIAEGEYFTGDIVQYVQPVRLPKVGHLPNVEFYVKKIEPEDVNDIPVDIKVYVEVKNKDHIISINRPLKINHTYFVIRNLGVAPLIILYDRDGRERDGAYVRLDVFKGKKGGFILSGQVFEVLFYPDFYIEGDKMGTRSEVVKNPVFFIKLAGSSESVLIKPGERKKIGQYELYISDMRYWVRFVVVRERGLGIVYTGFSIMSLALIIRLIFYRKEIRGVISEQEGKMIWKIGGRSEFYKHLFSDEFKRIIDELSLRIQKPL